MYASNRHYSYIQVEQFLQVYALRERRFTIETIFKNTRRGIRDGRLATPAGDDIQRWTNLHYRSTRVLTFKFCFNMIVVFVSCALDVVAFFLKMGETKVCAIYKKCDGRLIIVSKTAKDTLGAHYQNSVNADVCALI